MSRESWEWEYYDDDFELELQRANARKQEAFEEEKNKISKEMKETNEIPVIGNQEEGFIEVGSAGELLVNDFNITLNEDRAPAEVGANEAVGMSIDDVIADEPKKEKKVSYTDYVQSLKRQAKPSKVSTIKPGTNFTTIGSTGTVDARGIWTSNIGFEEKPAKKSNVVYGNATKIVNIPSPPEPTRAIVGEIATLDYARNIVMKELIYSDGRKEYLGESNADEFASFVNPTKAPKEPIPANKSEEIFVNYNELADGLAKSDLVKKYGESYDELETINEYETLCEEYRKLILKHERNEG